MKITSSSLRDLEVIVALGDVDRFDIDYDPARRNHRDQGAKLQVNRLRALVDLKDGSVIVAAYGFLYNKDGQVGERTRDQYLETDQIPVEVRHIIAEEWRHTASLVGAVSGVKFA